MTDLQQLALRIEGAEPDRELDFYIWAAANGVTGITNPAEGHPMTPGRGGRVEGYDANGEWHLYGFVDPGQVNRNWTPYGGDDRYPAFTASLDAALSLAKDFSEAQLWMLWNEALCRCSKAGASLRDDLPRFLAAAALRAIDKENCDGRV